jgi:hypothetical protein
VVTEDVRTDPDQRWRDRIELVATILLALATVLTAWSAFQATKWSGTQSIHFARAGANRTESAKASTRANSETVIDVQTFIAWASAFADEQGLEPTGSGTYEPDPTKLSGFLYQRLREEFRPAVQEWIAEKPLEDPDAPATPFELPEYRLADQARSERLERSADRESALARRDNQRGDNYVLTTVLFASVLFFAGVSTKLTNLRSGFATISLAVLLVIIGIVLISTFPIQV